jgi:hypothetical protein
MPEHTTTETVYAVLVTDRMDGLYLFRNKDDAHRFHKAVLDAGSHADMTEEPISHGNVVDELIAQELED